MNVPSWAPLDQLSTAAPATALGGRGAVVLVERMPIAVVVLDGGARIHYLNGHAERLLGKSRSSYIGHVFTTEQVAADDRWKVTSALQTALAGERVTIVVRVGQGERAMRLVEMHLMPGARVGEVAATLLDLTEQSEIEAALHQSELLYNTFLEQSPVGLIHLDARGTVTFENHRFREIVGERPDDAWSGLSAFRIPGLDSLFGSAVKKLLNAQVVQDFHVRYAPPGRAPLQLLLNGSPIYREDGSVAGAMLMVQDVTAERARAEERAFHERFARAEAALREAVLDGSDESIFLRETARIFSQTLGADRAAVLVPDLAQEQRLVTRAIWGEGADTRTLRTFHLDELGLPDGPTPQPSVALPDDTGLQRVLVPFFGEHVLEGAILLERAAGDPLVHTASERPLAALTRLFETLWSWLRTTNRYRLTVATIEDALVNFVFEPDGTRRFLFLSPQTARITGQDAQAFVDHPEKWGALPYDSKAEVALGAHEARLRAGQESEVTFRIRQADGPRWLRERAVPHRDDAGQLSVVGIVSDVTERKRAEGVLLEAKTAAEVASREKTAFIATLSHEIRTPLGTVNGFADLLARELEEYEARTGTPLPPQIDEFVGTIRDRAHQILALVSDIFDLANLESGSVHLASAPLDVNDLVTERASHYAAPLSDKGIALHLDLDPAGPTVSADRPRLAQILDHLLANAVKFTAEGSVSIQTRRNGGEVSITVEDTGVGMSEPFVERLFTPFLQEDQRLNRDFSGVGIGLALVKRLVDLLGGRITVSSRKGEGTAFRVLLPATG